MSLNSQLDTSRPKDRTEEVEQQIAEYERLSAHYYDNATVYIKQEEYPKAGEALWGSINVYLKIISLIALHRPLSSRHGDIKQFVRALSNSVRDPELFRMYEKAEKLHANFYHNFLDKEEFDENFNSSVELLQKLYEFSRGFTREVR